MRLTDSDKQILKSWGYLDRDMEQIELATLSRFTTYEINDNESSIEEVIDVLGREVFLSGIGRSAFHWSSVRHGKNEEVVYFDSSRLFK